MGYVVILESRGCFAGFVSFRPYDQTYQPTGVEYGHAVVLSEADAQIQAEAMRALGYGARVVPDWNHREPVMHANKPEALIDLANREYHAGEPTNAKMCIARMKAASDAA